MKHKTLHQSLLLIVGLILFLSLTSASWAEWWPYPQVTLQDGWFGVSYLGMTDNGDGTSTWSYQVDELGSGKGFKDLSHWVLGLGDCTVILSADPGPYEMGTDPRTGVYGVKWEVNDGFESGVFSFTVQGVWAEALVNVGTKAGRFHDVGWITGPSCDSYDPDGGGQIPDGGEDPPPDGDGGGYSE